MYIDIQQLVNFPSLCFKGNQYSTLEAFDSGDVQLEKQAETATN